MCFSNAFLPFEITQSFNKFPLSAPWRLYLGNKLSERAREGIFLGLADQEIGIKVTTLVLHYHLNEFHLICKLLLQGEKSHQSIKAMLQHSLLYSHCHYDTFFWFFEWLSRRTWDIARPAEQWAGILMSSGWGSIISVCQCSSFYMDRTQWSVPTQIGKCVIIWGILNFN